MKGISVNGVCIMHWLDSKTIKYLFFTWFGTFLLQIVPMIRAHSFDWWILAAEAVATLAGIVIRMAQDDVIAPKALDTLSGGRFNRAVPPVDPKG